MESPNHDDAFWTIKIDKSKPIEDILELIEREMSEIEKMKLTDELLKILPQPPRTTEIYADMTAQQERLRLKGLLGYNESKEEKWFLARRKSGADVDIQGG